MDKVLADRYVAAQDAALYVRRRRAALSQRASVVDEELAAVVKRYESLMKQRSNAPAGSATQTRELNAIVQQRQRLIEEKITLGDQYAALSEAESQAQRLVSDLRQQLDEHLWGKRGA